jgi:basic amino acid/polyamine antiporter, APA family
VSVVAIANLTLMYVSRVTYAMARDRVLPAMFASVAQRGAPRNAVLVTALVAAAFAATGGYERLIAIAVPVSSFVYLAMDASAIRMRYREPALPRPFRMPLFPLPAVLGFVINAGLLGMLFYEDALNSSLGLGLAVLIGVAYKLRSMLPSGAHPAPTVDERTSNP